MGFCRFCFSLLCWTKAIHLQERGSLVEISVNFDLGFYRFCLRLYSVV